MRGLSVILLGAICFFSCVDKSAGPGLTNPVFGVDTLILDSRNVCEGDFFSIVRDTSVLNRVIRSSFSSRNPSVVSVDSTGHCTALLPGSAIVLCSLQTSFSTVFVDTSRITVGQLDFSFYGTNYAVMSKDTINLWAGEKVSFTAESRCGSQTLKIALSTSDPNVASIDDSGNLCGVALGTALLRVVAMDSSSRVHKSWNIPIVIEWERLSITGGETVRDPVDQTLLCASDSNGLVVSRDSGHTWEQKDVGESFNVSKAMYSIRISPSNPNVRAAIVAVRDSPYVWYAGDHYYALFSTTSGSNWFRKDLPCDHYPNMVFNPHNPDSIYMTMVGPCNWNGVPLDGVLRRSTDQGNTWVFVRSLGSSSLIPFYIDPIDARFLYTCGSRSEDGGMTWELLNDNSGLRGDMLGILLVNSLGQLFVVKFLTVQYYPLLISSNRGTSFAEVFHGENSDARVLTECSSNPSVMIAILYEDCPTQAIRLTRDGGVSWRVVSFPIHDCSFSVEMPQNPFIISESPLRFVVKFRGHLWRYKGMVQL